MDDAKWYEDDSDEELEDYAIDQYDLAASPNDFNIQTIFNFMESGAVSIPGFQRNYVWDQKRASKLIESLVMGLPVPQIFLYEEERNRFLVIDGQQRLMSIYYFIRQRFPRKEKRAELRRIFEEHGRIPDEVLQNDEYFTKFGLQLKSPSSPAPSRFEGLNYVTLGDYKTAFDLRTIRNIIVKQISPTGDDSAIYEIFNRLNSGGVNLKPQEIRSSLYHSKFLDLVLQINSDPRWRRLVGVAEPDLHMKDAEFLIRGFAMLIEGANYAPSMVRFLNTFSRKMKAAKPELLAYLRELHDSFLRACAELPDTAFFSTRGRFSVAIFEAVFTATAEPAFQKTKVVEKPISAESIAALKIDAEFLAASESRTTDKANVAKRLNRARAILR